MIISTSYTDHAAFKKKDRTETIKEHKVIFKKGIEYWNAFFGCVYRMKAAEEKVKKMTEEKKDVAKKTKEVGGLKSKLKDKLKT